jgi:hypothetical protein
MDIEVVAVERLPDEQNRFGRSNLVFQLSSRKNTTGARRIRQRRSKIALTKYVFIFLMLLTISISFESIMIGDGFIHASNQARCVFLFLLSSQAW